VLTLAADENLKDTRTMRDHAYERVASGAPMPGVVEVPDLMPVGEAIHELALVVQLMDPGEMRDRVVRLPL
jgi:hypothetical protein